MNPELFLTEPTTLTVSRRHGLTHPEKGVDGVQVMVEETATGRRISNIKRLEFDDIEPDKPVSGTAYCHVKDEQGNWATDSLGNLKVQAIGVYIVFPEMIEQEPAKAAPSPQS